jgi:LmbE family N-acetylglucosaminyl deacetylase
MLSEQIIQSHFTFQRPLIWRIAAGMRIVVLAPHPDDEVIGAGGSLFKHLLLGNEMKVIYITDGREGRRKDQSIEQIVAIRMAEARAACHMLGIEPCFLGVPDQGDLLNEQVILELRHILHDFQPHLIYLPHKHDSHRDHFLTNVLLYMACNNSSIASMNLDVGSYEIWSPLHRVNRLVNISELYGRKRQMMEEYQSQLSLIPYMQIMEGLNKYRTSHLPFPGITHVEAFWVQSIQDFMKDISSKNLFVTN